LTLNELMICKGIQLLYIVQVGVLWRNLRNNITWETVYYNF